MERIRLLLQELVIERLQTRLSGLLLGLTCGQLRLSARKSGSLSACAEGGQLLRRACSHAVEALSKALTRLSGG